MNFIYLTLFLIVVCFAIKGYRDSKEKTVNGNNTEKTTSKNSNPEIKGYEIKEIIPDFNESEDAIKNENFSFSDFQRKNENESVENNLIICPECNYANESNSKFCQECSYSFFMKNINDNQTQRESAAAYEFEPAPKKGITIEFFHSTAATFEFAVKEAELLPGFRKFGDGKKALYRVTIDQDNLISASNLLDNLKGWRKRAVYIDGEKVTWDSVFSYVWCAREKKACFDPKKYCFGSETEWNFNLWGCFRAGLPFRERAEWFSYGRWLNKQGDWEFDKKRIKHELERKLYEVRFCPYLNVELVQDVLEALPPIVNPLKNKNWAFMESYSTAIPGGLIIESNDYGFVSRVVVKGVYPVGLGYMNEIKQRMKLRLPDGV